MARSLDFFFGYGKISILIVLERDENLELGGNYGREIFV
jgi:hypothetical protein